MGGDSTNDTSGGTSGIKLTTVTNPYANSTIRVLPSPPDESRPVAHAAEAAAIANASKVTKNNGTKHKRKYKISNHSQKEKVKNFQATMKQKKEAKVAKKKRQKESMKKNFFEPLVRNESNCLPAAEQNNIANTTNDTTNNNADDDTMEHAGGDDDIINPASDDDDEIEVENPTLNSTPLYDIIANLDYDEREEEGKNDSDESSPIESIGAQQSYVRAIHKRLQEEVNSKDLKGEPWLLSLLKKNDWWIRRVHASTIVKKLHLNKEYDAYYRDVYVWLPDVRYKDVEDTYMPSCPNCKCNKHVGAHAFRDNHFARIVVNLKETYYVMSRRYICHECKRTVKKAKKDIEKNAAEIGLSIRVEEDIKEDGEDINRSYTFMGWDKRILPLFQKNRGEEFPAFLTWKAGVDKGLIDMMRPLFDGGFRPERFSDMLLELHSKEYTRQCIKHENRILAHRESVERSVEYSPLSNFSDKKKYHGIVPSGKYIAEVYKQYERTILAYLDMEVKKRGAEILHWDVSYKEAKHLCLYRGRSVFKGLVTAMNEVGEVRIQFHIYTDSHEQMKAALEAFKRTTSGLGLPEVRIFFTDNPSGDKKFFPEMLPSLRAQQEKFDELYGGGTPELMEDESDLPLYPSSRIKIVRMASTTQEIENQTMALLENVNGNRIGLDAEWNKEVNATTGMQTGRSRIHVIQVAYRNSDDELIVIVCKMGKIKRLPNRLESLLSSRTINIFGVKVSADLKYIGEDFNVVELKKVDQKKRKNVQNLGMFARVRDVVQDAGAGLDLICRRVLNVQLDKSLQCSDWSGDLSESQINYAAVDAAVSLEAGEGLDKMPDLTRRLTPEELTPGRKVDLLPQSGNVACMATRAATATIVGTPCKCPEGMVYKTSNRKNAKSYTKMKAGKGSYIVRIEKVYAPALIVPKYKWRRTDKAVTLRDIPIHHDIIVPIAMIKEHVDSEGIRATPIEDAHGATATEGRSKPATDDEPTEKRARKRPRISPSEGYDFVDLDGYDDDDDDDEETEEGFVSYSEYTDSEEALEQVSMQLTSKDIDYLQSALFDGESAQSANAERAVLQSEHLSAPPDPKDMKNRYSAVLGDVFHAMDRTKVPVRHEAKKGFFVALRDAFFVWNPSKLKELEKRMKESGMSDEQIRLQKYFNTKLYRDCIDRKVPSSTMLYWRVRAVYIAYGSMIDSKTKVPLFNKRAWGKADNLLKEILLGFYSDPPGIELYNKRLRANCTVMTNKYGMEMIECLRGTNRTEAYHKNITTTFGTWSTGIEMSDYLLAERRHRHNHRVSERRRFGFPKIGHFDTWLIDLYQRLARRNHDIDVYPEWTNASDYVFTDEGFGTVPLHTQSLHDALATRYEQLDATSIKLTPDQQYLCRVMGTPLPFLPFSGESECKEYAKFVTESDNSMSDAAAAIAWCKHVNGTDIQPKLESHLRTHREEWNKNQRVKDSVSRAESTNEKLKELNEKISPTHTSETEHSSETESAILTANVGQRVLPQQPHVQTVETVRQQLPQPILTTRPNSYWTSSIAPYQMFCAPAPQAIVHSFQQMIVGGVSIGNDLATTLRVDSGTKQKRGGRGRPKGSKNKNPKPCGRCQHYNGRYLFECRGRGKPGRNGCEYFFEDGRMKPCSK